MTLNLHILNGEACYCKLYRKKGEVKKIQVTFASTRYIHQIYGTDKSSTGELVPIYYCEDPTMFSMYLTDIMIISMEGDVVQDCNFVVSLYKLSLHKIVRKTIFIPKPLAVSQHNPRVAERIYRISTHGNLFCLR